jgi:MEMO1 family protein
MLLTIRNYPFFTKAGFMKELTSARILPMKRFILMIAILALCASCASRESSAKVKKSNLAGRWYPAEQVELARQIDSFLKGTLTGHDGRNPLVMVLPHAGYAYSGPVAGAGYRILGTSGKPAVAPGLIVIIGPSHYSAFGGCSLIDAEYFETPLGRVKIDTGAADRLLESGLFRRNPSAFEQEHSIEIHLPFLQRIFRNALEKDLPVLPILAGEMDDAGATRAAGSIAAAVSGMRPLFIISSDFTHYGPNFGYEPFKNTGSNSSKIKLKGLDDGAVEFIVKKDLAGFSGYAEKTGITICGRNPIKIALALPVDDFRAERVAYDTSGNITGSYANSVSYEAILFSGRLKGAAPAVGTDAFPLTDGEKQYLLRAARDNIRSWFDKKRGIRFFPTDVPKNCLEKRGVFVTLKKHGELRGCIGYLTGLKPLVQAVLDNSYNAAFKDPRFEPLAADELKDITIEISVLTEPAPVRSADEIRTGRDGLIVERGPYRGLLLPQVAEEQGWDRNRFLDETCRKAGLPAGSWKDGETKIYRFQAIVFGEGLK